MKEEVGKVVMKSENAGSDPNSNSIHMQVHKSVFPLQQLNAVF